MSAEMAVIVERLCAQVPRAIGALLCDFEGEAVVSSLGRAPVPEAAHAKVREHVPRTLSLEMPVAEFLMRLGGAEPCAPLKLLSDSARRRGAGELSSLELRYQNIELLIDRLPNDFYLVLFLRRPALAGPARRVLRQASAALAEHLQ